MTQTIILVLAAIIWAVVRIISQPAPKRPVPRQAAPQHPSPKNSIPGSSTMTITPAKFTETARVNLAVEELDTITSPGLELSPENLVQGIILSEILGPPRAKNPHRLYKR